ncbi:TFIIB-type zinc ribbon-containing protein [Allocoleopsis franciscana]|nr:zf-TFIIB domain-containing protein [Allocoleopsis franciscana]
MKGAEIIDVGDPSTGKKFDAIGTINCPKCKTQMTKMVDLNQSHIRYEKCPVCYGVWFDAGEFKDYKEENLSDIFKSIFSKERR